MPFNFDIVTNNTHQPLPARTPIFNRRRKPRPRRQLRQPLPRPNRCPRRPPLFAPALNNLSRHHHGRLRQPRPINPKHPAQRPQKPPNPRPRSHQLLHIRLRQQRFQRRSPDRRFPAKRTQQPATPRRQAHTPHPRRRRLPVPQEDVYQPQCGRLPPCLRLVARVWKARLPARLASGGRLPLRPVRHAPLAGAPRARRR